MSFLKNLEWRYATKMFDPAQKVSDADFATIKKAIRFTPTSFGLEPFHVVEVTDPKIRAAIREKAWDQGQVTDASHLFVFCARTDLIPRVDEYFKIASGNNLEVRAKMKEYEQMMTGAVSAKTGATALEWASRQAYIGLGFAMAACAELSIDSCPMEGFDPVGVKEILGLPAHITPVVMLPVGYRLPTDKVRAKVRFPESDLFSTK